MFANVLFNHPLYWPHPLSYWPRPIYSLHELGLTAISSLIPLSLTLFPLFRSLGVDLGKKRKKKKKKQKPRNYSWSAILSTLPLHIGSEDDGSHLFIFHSVISHFILARPQEGKTEWGEVGQTSSCQRSTAQHLQGLLGIDWPVHDLEHWSHYSFFFNSVLASPPTDCTVTIHRLPPLVIGS